MLRVTLVDIYDWKTSERERSQRISELKKLISTYGGLLIITTIQKKDTPAYRTYIGQGKLDMIIEEMVEKKSDLLIVGNILKSAQIYHINEQLREASKDSGIVMEARDRVDLILKIFDKHASSAEAKLQIELASIKHMGPRIFGMGMELSKQGGSASGGNGASRGQGETNTEIMKRHLKTKTHAIEKKLKEYERMRSLHRTRRKRVGFPVFGIVGYTNAGKSSLLTTLSNKESYIADKLFATLGTEVAKLYLHPPADCDEEGNYVPGKEVLVVDTIGFMRDLPPQLIKAFSSTLEDSIQSDVLLHVVDASDPDRQNKIQIVNNILVSIGATQSMWYIFNKIDKLDSIEKKQITDEYGDNSCFVSALSGVGVESLKDKMYAYTKGL